MRRSGGMASVRAASAGGVCAKAQECGGDHPDSYLVLQYLSLGSGDGRGYSLLKKGDAQGVADRPVLCHSPPCPAGLCLSPREGQSTTKGSGGVSCLHCMTVIL